MKPILLYGHHAGPNPKKVVMVLEELKIPYEIKLLEFLEMKQPAYEKINPNGRVPAIEDPNTGITLWESGAIIEYLVEKYDKNRVISFQADTPESYHAKQWLHFQASGQGPYFGQAGWFKIHHREQLQSAVDRYINEIRRVSGVLNGVLQGREYLWMTSAVMRILCLFRGLRLCLGRRAIGLIWRRNFPMFMRD